MKNILFILLILFNFKLNAEVEKLAIKQKIDYLSFKSEDKFNVEDLKELKTLFIKKAKEKKDIFITQIDETIKNENEFYILFNKNYIVYYTAFIDTKTVDLEEQLKKRFVYTEIVRNFLKNNNNDFKMFLDDKNSLLFLVENKILIQFQIIEKVVFISIMTSY